MPEFLVSIITSTTADSCEVHGEADSNSSWVISGFRRGVNEICASVECYAA
jgi:hypothetical protein